METFQIKTATHCCAVDITNRIEAVLKETSARNGVCLIYIPHTTAAVTINEGADKSVMDDVLNLLERAVPWQGDYKHAEGNSAAHIKSVLAGGSAQVIVDSGHLALGTWQRIFLLEFDGPRTRRVLVQFTGERAGL